MLSKMKFADVELYSCIVVRLATKLITILS